MSSPTQLQAEVEFLRKRVRDARRLLAPLYDCDPEIREWLHVADHEDLEIREAFAALERGEGNL